MPHEGRSCCLDISIAWNTYQQLNQSCVKYGTKNDSLTEQVCTTTSKTYPTSRTWFNAVVLSGLEPNTTYYYKIVSTNSSVDFFMSPRPAGDTTSFGMGVVIDMGVYGEDGFTTDKRDLIPKIQPSLNHSTIGRLAETVDDYDFIIHPGDFAYADKWWENEANRDDGEAAYESIIERFYDQLAPISGRKPYMASPGNHEATCDIPHHTGVTCPGGQSNFSDFMHRWGDNMPLPFNSSSSNAAAKANATAAQKLALPPFWYSFEYGMAHIVMFNTETDFPNAPDSGSTGNFGKPNQQLDFLAADLASVDRTVTPWVVVAGHRPWYTTGGDAAVCHACQDAFEPIFYEYGVDLAIFGHVHNSQRFMPVNNSKIDPAGMNDPRAPMYIVAGGAGNIEGMKPIGENMTSNRFAYRDGFSYAKVLFKDKYHLQVDFMNSRTGDLLDSSVLYKSHAQQFTWNSTSESKSDSDSSGTRVMTIVLGLAIALPVLVAAMGLLRNL